jgi:hypothetical protein
MVILSDFLNRSMCLVPLTKCPVINKQYNEASYGRVLRWNVQANIMIFLSLGYKLQVLMKRNDLELCLTLFHIRKRPYKERKTGLLPHTTTSARPIWITSRWPSAPWDGDKLSTSAGWPTWRTLIFISFRPRIVISMSWISSSDQRFSRTSGGSCSLRVDGNTDHADTRTHTHALLQHEYLGFREVLTHGVQLSPTADTTLIFQRRAETPLVRSTLMLSWGEHYIR